MNAPWIEVAELKDEEGLSGPGAAEYVWQASFACQVGIPPHQEWVKFKWGFNALALFDEALERQRLFLESQHIVRTDLGTEEPDQRTLAFRYISRPGQGLLFAIIGKIRERTQTAAKEKAQAFFRELNSIFPYDYLLVPAQDKDEYLLFSGAEILDASGSESSFAQIKRIEIPMHLNRNAPALQGLWQSSARAHEQIWRALAASASPLLLNISLRGTVLYAKERERMLKCADEISNISPDESLNQKTLSGLKQWNKTYIERRLNPWEKFFYLQVHLVGRGRIDENILRVAGATLALSKEGQSLPGYLVVSPKFGEEVSWRRKLRNLDVIFSGSYLPVPRLSEVADLEEVFAVMRIPYSPPENGFPDLRFATPRAIQE
jgi:hypothetical protein